MTWNQYTSLVTKLANVVGKHRYPPDYVQECFKHWKDRDFIELHGIVEKAIGFAQFVDLNQPVKVVRYPVVIRQKEPEIDPAYLERHLALNGAKSVWELIEKSKKSDAGQ